MRNNVYITRHRKISNATTYWYSKIIFSKKSSGLDNSRSLWVLHAYWEFYSTFMINAASRNESKLLMTCPATLDIVSTNLCLQH